MNIRQSVELFHLLFLDQLSRKLDKNCYSLKGGCNLRFFLKSIRYSEDIDIDVFRIQKETLANNVRKILASTPLSLLLKQHQIEIQTISEPKQTDTTQRWKVLLKKSGIAMPLNTKIEFSRRGNIEDYQFDSIDPVLLQTYQLTPINCNHYIPEVAFNQKVQALAGREETQARDIFDLFLLINLGVKPKKQNARLITNAIEKAMTINFPEFKSQVIAFLPQEYHVHYDSQSIWDNIVFKVVQCLEDHHENS